MILGTVQFGLDYGINNSSGQVGRDEAFHILDCCADRGIRYLDTAPAYGTSEQLLGDYLNQRVGHDFQVITKLNKTDNIGLAESVTESLRLLSCQKLNTILFHSFDHYKKAQLIELQELKNEGIIEKIGVSVYTNHEVLEIIDDNQIDLIQLPFNLLDNHSQRGEVLTLAKNSGKEIHTRSVFLQGLFFRESELISPKLTPLKKHLNSLGQLASDFNIPMNQLALGYALSKDYIDAVLIGVDSQKQLLSNVDLINKPLDNRIFQEIDTIDVKERELLYPFNW